ncbi:hypothetical protein CAG99_10050 [Streptomyces marincola]|uniref:Uncharacterized protein n=1 Tax=Streptomyces marincola TaxID=2878388 RepID=A0A1W7CWV4_9ACTN|nr:hypothetical protein CAG99_10050 [Streptomyces marincola]
MAAALRRCRRSGRRSGSSTCSNNSTWDAQAARPWSVPTTVPTADRERRDMAVMRLFVFLLTWRLA